MSKYSEIRKIDVTDKVEKKNDLSYLSWSWAWDAFKQAYPDAVYEIIKDANGIPYFETDAGVMCYTRVTAEGITHEMWLPVMDGANKAMKSAAYQYKTKYGEKTCQAFDMFDVNKTLMRCLVKNLAMFGLGLYLYSGEDLPPVEEEDELMANVEKIRASLTPAELKVAFATSYNKYKTNKKLLEPIMKAYEDMKAKLNATS